MTKLQKQRAKMILTERETLKNDYIIDLLLDFWQETNQCYKQKINNITRICWQKNEKGSWDCSVYDEKIKRHREFDTVSIEEGKLQNLLFEISRIEPRQIMNREKDIKALGLKMGVAEEVIMIRISED